MIKYPMQTRRALLVWQRPLNEGGRRDRFAVAELVQEKSGVSFRYLEEELLKDARKAGFTHYPGLPVGSPRHDRIALEVLMRRLPPRDRADFSDFLNRFGLPKDGEYSDLSLLAYTGARMTRDSFSICETFDGFSLPVTYIFHVAGNRHHVDYNDVSKGEAVILERESGNPHDPNAIRLIREDGGTIGYVNRLQAQKIGIWLDSGSVSASVFRVNGKARIPRLFVRVEFS